MSIPGESSEPISRRVAVARIVTTKMMHQHVLGDHVEQMRPDDRAGDRADRDEQRDRPVDVAVSEVRGEAGERDREGGRERRAVRAPSLHLGDPDEPGDHDEAPADPEQSTEQSRRDADDRSLAELHGRG